jgi:hypothetical protein
VIESKVAKHNIDHKADAQILGIYKGINDDEIRKYMSNEQILFKKILITPESYDLRLKPLLADIWDCIKKEYYLLIDECERTIQDKDYRGRISAPFDDFFSFTNKGLILATTLPFSDPRFESLIHYDIQPQYVYTKPPQANHY